MTFADTYTWGTIGQIPAESNFFDADLDIDDVMDGNGLVMGYSKLVGEQVFKITDPSETPFTTRLTGAPIKAGAGWIERLIKRLGAGDTTPGQAKAGMIRRKAPQNVTADDDLRYYDSYGKEFVYESENVKGWVPVSLPSDLDIYDMFTEKGGMNKLNSILVDNVKKAYDMALEAEIQTKAVNLLPKHVNTTNRGKALFTELRDYVSKFKSDDYAFNYMSNQDNQDYEHKSRDVIIFMNRIQYNAMMDDFSSLYSPDFIKEIGAEIVQMDNAMPTPYADGEAMYDAGFTDYGGLPTKTVSQKVVLDEDKIPMLGQDAPDIIVMDKRWIEYRPVINSYKVNISKNGAGDFINEHLLYTGGLNVKPWANAIGINLTE